MLLPYTTLTYYGPAAAAGVPAGGASLGADVKATARASAVSGGTGDVTLAKPTRLRNSPATLDITPGLAKGNWESNTVMLTGVNTSSCRSRTGAAYVMSPRT